MVASSGAGPMDYIQFMGLGILKWRSLTWDQTSNLDHTR